MLQEKISKNLGLPYIYLPKDKKFLCQNGVLFTLDEYKEGIDIAGEYERRSIEDELYDYDYAKETGILRKKEKEKDSLKRLFSRGTKGVILLMLFSVSIISMYISTMHTSEYLMSYVSVFSAYLMSLSVTFYNGTALEASILFKQKGKYLLMTIFVLLWALVTSFSMVTTIAVFFEKYSFNESTLQEENAEVDITREKLSMLKIQEKDLRDAIEFKKKDIEYRQSKEYATNALRLELNDLQEALQSNLQEQSNTISETKVTENAVRKESFYTVAGRIVKVRGDILEFVMSIMAALFVNLIAPLSLSACLELTKRD